MLNRTYQVEEQAFEAATINLAQVSAMLGMLAENGDHSEGFSSTERAVQVIFGCQQMIDETKEKLQAGYKGIVDSPTPEIEPLTSGM